MGAISLRDTVKGALAEMRARGFDEAQATVAARRQDEVNINLNEPSLLRSTDSMRLGLVGILDGRRASTELTDLRADSVREGVQALLASARSAPQDKANKVSSGQKARIVQGPQESDVALLTGKARELLEFGRAHAPKVNIVEALAAHTLVRSHTMTSGGSDLEAQCGYHTIDMFGTAREGQKTSSFAATGGDAHDIESQGAADYFGIGEVMTGLERSIHTEAVGAQFVGDVVLAPQAVSDLVGWLLGQLCDEALISGSSVYRDRVGDTIGSPLLTLKSRFDAPGVVALTMDAFVAYPVEVMGKGVLKTLTPSLYGSLKTGLAHVPTAAGGWEMLAGETSREKLVADVQRGALVNRLSMGRPAANGDFSGVIKNSFRIDGGKVGAALSETMITGNVAQMLRDVAAVSRERIDTGSLALPWLRIGGLHFS
jgi:PmbA protein